MKKIGIYTILFALISNGQAQIFKKEPRSPIDLYHSSLSRSQVGLKSVRLPDGTYMVDLKGRFMSPLKATIQPDGSIKIEHERDDHVKKDIFMPIDAQDASRRFSNP